MSLFVVLQISAIAQTKYFPDGDPKKLQFEITPVLWLPWVSGQVGAAGPLKNINGNINATPADLINHLKMFADLNLDISKGHVIGFVDYIYLSLASDNNQAPWQPGGFASWSAQIKSNVLDIAGGGRFNFNKGMVDGFVGVRYFDLDNALQLNYGNSSKNGSAKITYWDPFFGTRLFYYPKERMKLFLRADVGGIWGGAAGFSFNSEAKFAYAVSPTIDIAGGFRYWTFKYSENNNIQNTSFSRSYFINPSLYGFELSATFMIPKRSNADKVFPKIKN